jgi:putative Ca2+/H+ antiporter (TMEM165/GDT1 family)
MTALFTSFFLVALAEMADKTQLLTLSLACRYPARTVLMGVALAIGLLNLVAVAAGALLGQLLPIMWVKVAAGVLFVGFGVWTLLARGDDEEEGEDVKTGPGRNAVLAVMGAFIIAEIGDKTQLATFTLAARYETWLAYALVWLGATLGMLLANGLAIGGGALLASRMPRRLLMRLSGVLFLVVGVWTILEALVF